MGRRFSSELSHLKDTYEWSTIQSVDRLTHVIGPCRDLPLIGVGSGGSLSAASYAVSLHEAYSGILGTVMTPLEFSYRRKLRREAAVLFLSASGRNPDIVNALKLAALSEPSRLIALCMQTGSRMASLAKVYSFIDLIEFKSPVGKDGFLATNSLLATSLLLYRTYQMLSGGSSTTFPCLAKTYRKFVGLAGDASVSSSARESRYAPLWQRDHLIVLCGPSTMAAAIDLESKFTEAALGTVQVADYRNFAHGRHHWLAKRNQETAVLSFASRHEQSLAKRTTRLLPSETVQVYVQLSESGPLAGLSALNEVFYIVSSAGKARGIDPGRPGVPLFGRKLYHLSAGRTQRFPDVPKLPPNEAIAISRKANADVAILAHEGTLREWQKAYRTFIKRLKDARFGAIVLDYDGTLCGEGERFTGMRAEIAKSLTELLDAGILVGIATGRGDSARDDLQKAIPHRVWRKVVVGYHNGAEVATLCEAKMSRQGKIDPGLRSICRFLKNDFRLRRLIEEYRPSSRQISLRAKPGVSLSHVYELVTCALSSLEERDFCVRCSAHAVDVLAKDVSKLVVYESVCRMLEEQRREEACSVLCIGDRGRFPGNDAELLIVRLSLSVDEVSPDPTTCWNLAPPGVRGVQAMIGYLDTLKVDGRGVFRILASRRRTAKCHS